MKKLLVILLVLISSSVAVNPSVIVNGEEGKAIDGYIVDVDWPNSDIHRSATATLIPRVVIKNTGPPTTFNVKFSVQGPNKSWYYGSCTTTNKLQHDAESSVWPSEVQINSSMPKGSYTARVQLFSGSGYCYDLLYTATKYNAFKVE